MTRWGSVRAHHPTTNSARRKPSSFSLVAKEISKFTAHTTTSSTKLHSNISAMSSKSASPANEGKSLVTRFPIRMFSLRNTRLSVPPPDTEDSLYSEADRTADLLFRVLKEKHTLSVPNFLQNLPMVCQTYFTFFALDCLTLTNISFLGRKRHIPPRATLQPKLVY